MSRKMLLALANHAFSEHCSESKFTLLSCADEVEAHDSRTGREDNGTLEIHTRQRHTSQLIWTSRLLSVLEFLNIAVSQCITISLMCNGITYELELRSAVRHLFIGSAFRIDFSWVQQLRKSSISRNEQILSFNNHYWGSNRCKKGAL